MPLTMEMVPQLAIIAPMPAHVSLQSHRVLLDSKRKSSVLVRRSEILLWKALESGILGNCKTASYTADRESETRLDCNKLDSTMVVATDMYACCAKERLFSGPGPRWISLSGPALVVACV